MSIKFIPEGYLKLVMVQLGGMVVLRLSVYLDLHNHCPW